MKTDKMTPTKYWLSDRIRSGTEIMQRIVGGDRNAIIELADEVTRYEDVIQAAQEMFKTEFDDVIFNGPHALYKAILNVRKSLRALENE